MQPWMLTHNTEKINITVSRNQQKAKQESSHTCTVNRSSRPQNKYHMFFHRGNSDTIETEKPPVFSQTPPITERDKEDGKGH